MRKMILVPALVCAMVGADVNGHYSLGKVKAAKKA